jgi:hypothetical protein
MVFLLSVRVWIIGYFGPTGKKVRIFQCFMRIDRFYHIRQGRSGIKLLLPLTFSPVVG